MVDILSTDEALDWLENNSSPEAKLILDLLGSLHQEVDSVEEYYTDIIERIYFVNLRVIH